MLFLLRKDTLMATKDEKFIAKKKAAEEANKRDQAAKEALQIKMAQKGGAGKLSKKELELAKRMGDNEGKKR